MLWYEEFHAAPPLPAVDAVRQLGARPVITWEPWHWRGRCPVRMRELAAGVHDRHLRWWAAQLATAGCTVYLRFGHEFNGHWYPWSPASGVSPQCFVEAWRHIHDVVSDACDTASWVWSPTAGVPPGPALEEWYPGERYVDVIGVDGYNWGASQAWSRWVQPDELFGATLAEITTITADKPVLITEVGCSEAGGSKADWIGALLDYLTTRPEIEGLIWFDHDKETDWRITSSPETAAAMATALRRTTSRRPWGSLR
ncbi:glycoside hydrolase family 26 protein [Mycolicibacterium sp.]|uniref:glycoside hydrolase family 26 protein n=1 Tax=Mycolicibacterium sp. TaxID=2320850 RepID=UPI003D0DA3AE